MVENWGSFTGDEIDKFADVAWEAGPHGLPMLTSCPDRMLLERVELIDVGEADHVCWLGRVDAAQFSADLGAPFRLSDADGLSPGHEADG